MEAASRLAYGRREAYLAAALEFRRMAFGSHSSEMQRAFMQLAVLYEELAEYVVRRVDVQPPAVN
jgi:hypothetical protein